MSLKPTTWKQLESRDIPFFIVYYSASISEKYGPRSLKARLEDRENSVKRIDMPTILIVEDNEDIRFNLVEYLESKGFKTDNTDDGLRALALTVVNKYDLIILDIMLPGMDGLRLCRELRNRSDMTPVIFLSAKDSTNDRIAGLAEGADDYLVKPFSLSELLLRIQAVLRRTNTKDRKRLQVGNLVLDTQSKQVFRGETEIKLNPTAFRILAYLMSRSPEVVSREEIEQEIWGFQRVAGDNLRAHIHQIRKSVDKPFEEPLVETRHGFGWAVREHEKEKQ